MHFDFRIQVYLKQFSETSNENKKKEKKKIKEKEFKNFSSSNHLTFIKSEKRMLKICIEKFLQGKKSTE